MSVTIIHKKGSGIPSAESLEVAEIAVDVVTGKLYTKTNDGNVVEISGSGGGTGSSVHIGDTPPTDLQEGQQWMEVPDDGDATMWIYDGGKWLQQPGGKDGAAGADGNIQDATEQGVIATWDDTNKQWTPDSSLTIEASGNATFSKNVNCKAVLAEFATIRNRNFHTDHFGLQMGSTLQLLPTDGNGTVGSGDISIGSSSYRFKDGWFSGNLYKNGSNSPLINAQELIETLSTLRNATKDETTIKGLRDAIGNAVGGLIEKFEAMQSTATQEIES